MIQKKWSLGKGTYYKTSIGDVSKTTIKHNFKMVENFYNEAIREEEGKKGKHNRSPLDYKKEIKEILEIIGKTIIDDYIARSNDPSRSNIDKRMLEDRLRDGVRRISQPEEKKIVDKFPYLVRRIEDYYDFLMKYDNKDDFNLENPLTSLLKDEIDDENSSRNLIETEIKELKAEEDQLKDISKK